jgi:hypothetical protein
VPVDSGNERGAGSPETSPLATGDPDESLGPTPQVSICAKARLDPTTDRGSSQRPVIANIPPVDPHF